MPPTVPSFKLRIRSLHPRSLIIFLCLSATALIAQSNTGSIAGHVADPKGVPVAGASVIVKNTDLTTTRTAVSDGHGDFRVTGLVPGALTVEAKGKGMATRRPVRVTLGLGSTVLVALTLGVAPVSQSANVTARRDTAEGNTVAPPVNKQEASVSSFFAGQTVTYLPNRDRDYSQFGQLGAGITEDAGDDGVVVAGQRVTGIVTQVDGVSFNDPLQGGRRGASDGAFFLPQTIVREFQIVRSGVTAEVGDTNAGLINVATKEGSNRVRGESFLTTRPGWATSSDAFGHQLDNRQNTFGLSYGGPIRHDRLFYYAGFEQDFLYAPTYLLFEPQPSGTVVPTSLTALQGQIIQKNSPGAVSVRLDELANEKNTLNLLVVINRIRGSKVGDGSTRTIATSDHTDSLSGQSLWSKASLATVVNGRSLNQIVVSYSGDHRNVTPNSTAPEQVINSFATFGGDSLGPHLSTSDQLQLADTFSATHGGASLDLGGAFSYDPFYEQREANLHGRYDYDSLANYLSNSPRRFQQTFVTGDTRYTASIRTLQFFANAKAPITKDLTLTAGLRWEAQFNPAPSAPNPAIAQTRTIPSDLTQFQPRLGLAWTPAPKTTARRQRPRDHRRRQLLRSPDPDPRRRDAALARRPAGRPHYPRRAGRRHRSRLPQSSLHAARRHGRAAGQAAPCPLRRLSSRRNVASATPHRREPQPTCIERQWPPGLPPHPPKPWHWPCARQSVVSPLQLRRHASLRRLADRRALQPHRQLHLLRNPR
jgi:hypothetical protein